MGDGGEDMGDEGKTIWDGRKNLKMKKNKKNPKKLNKYIFYYRAIVRSIMIW